MVINNINIIYIMCNMECRFIYDNVKCKNKRQIGKPYCPEHIQYFKDLAIKKKNKQIDKTFTNTKANNK